MDKAGNSLLPWQSSWLPRSGWRGVCKAGNAIPLLPATGTIGVFAENRGIRKNKNQFADEVQ